jgi:hypothetical protein
VKYFDCNMSYGLSARPAFRFARTPGELLAEMDHCGIDQALAKHAGQRFGSPSTYNDQVVAELADEPRLEAVWSLLPAQTGEQAPPERLLSQMTKAGVRCLWAFPEEHRYELDALTWGELCEALMEKRVPLFAKVQALAIRDLLKDFPDLIVVAVNQGPHSLERHLRPLLDAFPNLHLETSLYMVEGLIEEFCERYGPARLLYGSGFPDNCHGASRLRLAQADLSTEARELIAAGNLERLLGEVRL